MTPDPVLRHNVAMADFWSVADAETATTPCRDCGDALHAGELRAGMVRCQICDAVEDRAAHPPVAVHADGGVAPSEGGAAAGSVGVDALARVPRPALDLNNEEER